MSLINQLLKDLEKKPRTSLSVDSVMNDFKSQVSFELKKKKSYYVIIAILLSVLSCVLLVNNSKPIKKITFAASNKITSPVKITTPISSSAVGDTLLTGIALQLQQDVSYLRFLLNHNALYQISSNANQDELTIIFEHTHLVAALPKINYSGSGIKDIQAFNDEHGNLKLLLHLNQTAELKKLQLSDNDKSPELQLEIAYNNAYNNSSETMEVTPSALDSTVSLIKQPVAENSSELAYHEALTLLSQRPQYAITLLKNIVLRHGENDKARESLITALSQLGQKHEAKKILDQGLALQPTNPTFIKLKARSWVEEGKSELALALLEKAAPQITTDAEYYSLMAALYQQLGQANLAANVYKQLLSVQPSNAKWWVGLGIALETIGEQSQAYDAYTNADNMGGLDPELKSYLGTRLRTA